MRPSDSVLVVDVGTSNVRSAILHPDGTLQHERRVAVVARSPAPGIVEFDGRAISGAVESTASAVLEAAGPVGGVGIANQRATTVVWDRRTGEPVAPVIGWQDLRTVGMCLELQGRNIRLAPNASATKLATILDAVDPDRRRGHELCFGTIDTWAAWTLSGGRHGGLHITDPSNAGVTGMLAPGATHWDPTVLEALRIPPAMLPTIVDTSGYLGQASGLDGSPPSTAWSAISRLPWSARGAPDRGWPRRPSEPGGSSTS